MKSSTISRALVLSLLLLVGLSVGGTEAQSTNEDGSASPDDRSSDASQLPSSSGSDTWAGDYDNRDATARFEHLRVGERIQVRLTNGSQLQGEVIGLLGNRIQIEISNEQLTMSGSITLRSERIQSITKLDPLTPDERRKFQSIKEQFQANVGSTAAEAGTGESDTAGSTESTDESEKTSTPDSKRADQNTEETQNNDEEEKEGPPELTAQQQRLLDRFPADEWNQNRHEQLKSKYNFQRNSTQDAFLENWEEIQKAREIQEKRESYQLLQEFHPDDGWNPEKYRYIKENLASLEAKGIPARSPEQRRFLQVYDDWKEAYDRYKERQKEKQEEDKKASETSAPENEGAGSEQGTDLPTDNTSESDTYK